MSNSYYGNSYGSGPRKNKNGFVALLVVVALVLVGFGGAAGFGLAYLTNQIFNKNDLPKALLPKTTPSVVSTDRPAQTPFTQTPERPSSAPQGTQESKDKIYHVSMGESQNLSSEDVAALVSPSVVAIETIVETNYYGQLIDAPAAGSGVIISQDGYIVTNYHVIEGSKKATVILYSGIEYDAKLVGYSEGQDLALLKIDANNLLPVIFGSTDQVRLGQSVMAIGNPLGELAGTVTGGYISALDREIVVDGQKMHYMQTDAAINQGNSGGALVNMKGELIGIVSAKKVEVGVEGLSFAIPVDTVKKVIDDIVINGHRATPVIGITMVQFDTDEEAAYYRLNGAGIYISSVSDGSPAAKAGLRSGDKILSINGENITDSGQVAAIRDQHKVGEVLRFVIERNGVQYTVEITLSAKDTKLPLA